MEAGWAAVVVALLCRRAAGDTTVWSATGGSTVTVFQKRRILYDETLIVEAGLKIVCTSGRFCLEVEGQLRLLGTSDLPVTFTGTSDSFIHIYSSEAGVGGSHVVFTGNSSGCEQKAVSGAYFSVEEDPRQVSYLGDVTATCVRFQIADSGGPYASLHGLSLERGTFRRVWLGPSTGSLDISDADIIDSHVAVFGEQLFFPLRGQKGIKIRGSRISGTELLSPCCWGEDGAGLLIRNSDVAGSTIRAGDEGPDSSVLIQRSALLDSTVSSAEGRLSMVGCNVSRTDSLAASLPLVSVSGSSSSHGSGNFHGVQFRGVTRGTALELSGLAGAVVSESLFYNFDVAISASESLTVHNSSFVGIWTHFLVGTSDQQVDLSHNYWGGLTEAELPALIQAPAMSVQFEPVQLSPIPDFNVRAPRTTTSTTTTITTTTAAIDGGSRGYLTGGHIALIALVSVFLVGPVLLVALLCKFRPDLIEAAEKRLCRKGRQTAQAGGPSSSVVGVAAAEDVVVAKAVGSQQAPNNAAAALPDADEAAFQIVEDNPVLVGNKESNIANTDSLF